MKIFTFFGLQRFFYTLTVLELSFNNYTMC